MNENNICDINNDVNIDLIKNPNNEKSNAKTDLTNAKKTMELAFQKIQNPQMLKIADQIEVLSQNPSSSHDMSEFEIMHSKLNKIINQNTSKNFQNEKFSWAQATDLNTDKTLIKQGFKVMNYFKNKINASSSLQTR